MKIRILLVLLIFMVSVGLSAQDLWNKKIDDAQKLLCVKAEDNSCIIKVSNNTDANLLATGYVIDKVDFWQKEVTNNKSYTNNDKIKLLRVLLDYINEFNRNTKNRARVKDYSSNLAKELFNDFDKTIDAHLQKTTLADAVANKGVLSSSIIVGNEFAKMAKGFLEAYSESLYIECSAKPNRILPILNRFPSLRNADSLIVLAAYNNQDQLYDFAQCAKCPVSFIIKRSEHPLVQTLYKMSQMETGRSLTPFLDAISRKEITIDSINQLQKNQHQYYKLLVNTRIGYSKRLNNGDEILAINNFKDKIKEKAIEYVKEINELHTKADNIRFASLNPLNAQELYYVAVYGIDELYTSSFNRGVFAQMISKLNGLTTDNLLNSVNNDYFRKFIKISAGYNQLSKFLRLMPDSSAKDLMNRFISNLANNDNIQDIEDAVDVADAYVGIGSSVELKSTSEQILSKIVEYESLNKIENNTKGQTIYKLLSQIFASYRDTTKNLSAQIGLPPITTVPYNQLINSKNTTVVKLYFYGDEDKDGQMSYANFMGLFGDKSRWSVKYNKKVKYDFVEITSLKGKPIQIFANYPHYDPTKKTDPDDTAKLRMSEYMLKQGLQPSFVMHRGHSYHVPITLQYMNQYDTSAKLIVLGSCGGYQNLQSVLNICPESHIVSSKQTGTMHVNEPLLRILFNDLSNGKNIVWPTIWPQVRSIVAKDKMEMFEEYIPPHQNLGMIFYKAYKKQMGI